MVRSVRIESAVNEKKTKENGDFIKFAYYAFFVGRRLVGPYNVGVVNIYNLRRERPAGGETLPSRFFISLDSLQINLIVLIVL